MEVVQWPKPFLVFCLIPLVQAYTTFQTNCSAPATVFNYVASPNARGTLDILWSSLFTIIACTWTLQHPNVPEQRDGRDPGIRGDVKWGLEGFGTAIFQTILTLLAPETIVMTACTELFGARLDHKRMQEYARNGVPWSLSHTYFANMGGFVIRSQPTSESRYRDPYHLNCRGINALLRLEVITQLPDMTEEEIKDKSKGDSLVKAIAIGQILWSIIQIAVRAARKLAVSPLEAAVVAFSVCAAISYGLYWNKPQRIGVAHTILRYDGEIPNDLLDELEREQDRNDLSYPVPAGRPIKISSFRDWDDDLGVVVYGIVTVGAALFGGVHAFAWSFTFPSRAELIIWRCASISTTVIPVFLLSLYALYVATGGSKRYDGLPKRPRRAILGAVLAATGICSFTYAISRWFIIVEMLRTLFFLPPGSYVSTWTSNVPHLA